LWTAWCGYWKLPESLREEWKNESAWKVRRSGAEMIEKI